VRTAGIRTNRTPPAERPKRLEGLIRHEESNCIAPSVYRPSVGAESENVAAVFTRSLHTDLSVAVFC